jgi:hypothetical protein
VWCGHTTDDRPTGVHVLDESGMQREAAFKQYVSHELDTAFSVICVCTFAELH